MVALERGPAGAKELALVATLGAAAAAGRVLFAPIPSVKPVTMICVVTGATLGARAGLAVGADRRPGVERFLGQGPWTPPQMLLWAARRGHRGAAAPGRPAPWGLVALVFAWGFALRLGDEPVVRSPSSGRR